MVKYELPLFILFSVGFVSCAETNKTKFESNIEAKLNCETICSNPKWESSYQEKTSKCICWVDNTIDDIEFDLMQKQASAKNLTLWIIKNGEIRTKRETDQITTTEPPKPKSESKAKNKLILKKLKEDPILGISSKPNSKLACNPELLRIALHNLKSQIHRLSESLGGSYVNCALVASELEALRRNVQQVGVRSGDGPRLLDQIRERQAKLHSRLGHFEIPRRAGKLNLVGAKKESEERGNSVVTQPKELMG